MRLGASITAIVMLGCDGERAPVASSSAAPLAITAAPTATARRPGHRYFLSRTTSRCEIYRVDETGVSPSLVTPCPLDLQVGESIRIAGKTCMRESRDPDRIEPVVCPDPLTNQEKRDLGLVK